MFCNNAFLEQIKTEIMTVMAHKYGSSMSSSFWECSKLLSRSIMKTRWWQLAAYICIDTYFTNQSATDIGLSVSVKGQCYGDVLNWHQWSDEILCNSITEVFMWKSVLLTRPQGTTRPRPGRAMPRPTAKTLTGQGQGLTSPTGVVICKVKWSYSDVYLWPRPSFLGI